MTPSMTPCKLDLTVTIDQETEKSRKASLEALFTLVQNAVPPAGGRVRITIEAVQPVAQPGLMGALQKLGWVR